MKTLLISKYNVEQIDLPKTKEELRELLTDVYTEGYQDGYDDGSNEAKAFKARGRTGAVD